MKAIAIILVLGLSSLMVQRVQRVPIPKARVIAKSKF